MKRTILLLAALALVCSQKIFGQVNFFDAHVSKYGELEQVLGEKWDKIDSLIVHGPINEADFTTMWKCSFEGKLTVLNLEHAQVENNKIPTRALYKADRQVIDDPRAYQGVVYLPLRHIILKYRSFDYPGWDHVYSTTMLYKLPMLQDIGVTLNT